LDGTKKAEDFLNKKGLKREFMSKTVLGRV